MKLKIFSRKSLKTMSMATLGLVASVILLLGITGAGEAKKDERGPGKTGSAGEILASEGENWKMLIEPATEGKVGQVMKTVLHLLPKKERGFKFNLDYPARIRLLDPSGNLQMAVPRLERKDAASINADGAIFHILYTPIKTGKFTAEAVVTFGVCDPKKCQVAHDTLRWDVHVK